MCSIVFQTCCGCFQTIFPNREYLQTSYVPNIFLHFFFQRSIQRTTVCFFLDLALRTSVQSPRSAHCRMPKTLWPELGRPGVRWLRSTRFCCCCLCLGKEFTARWIGDAKVAVFHQSVPLRCTRGWWGTSPVKWSGWLASWRWEAVVIFLVEPAGRLMARIVSNSICD